jgi:transcriptional regulator with XRE-family HTH domain
LQQRERKPNLANPRFRKISQFLKKAREKTGLSQGEVAKNLGYDSCQFISNWERGMAAPPLTVLGRLAKLYNVKGEELFQVMLKDTERQMRKEFTKGLVG